eukprot:232612_1
MSAKSKKKTRFKPMKPKASSNRTKSRRIKKTRSKSMRDILFKTKPKKKTKSEQTDTPKKKKKKKQKKAKLKNAHSLKLPNEHKSHNQKKKKKKKKKKKAAKQKQVPKSRSMKIEPKNRPKNKHRLDVQTKKDMQMVKNRLNKRRESLKLNHKQMPNKPNKTSNKSRTHYTDKDLWNDYIATFGNTPQECSYLQNYSKTNEHHKTLTYKEARLIFDAFSNTSKTDSKKTSRAKGNRNSYIERDIQHAKRRLSQTLSMKQKISLPTKPYKKLSKDLIDEKQPYYGDDVKDDDTFKPLQPTMVQIKAFLESERVYVYDGLRIGYDTFLCRLEAHGKMKKVILSDNDIHSVFGNYQIIYNINSQLYEDLKGLKLDTAIDEVIYNLGTKMVDFIPYFKMYTEYIVKKHESIAYLEQLKKKNKAFKKFVKLNELCCNKKLKTLLEEPAHRVPQYLHYLVDIYSSYKHESDSNSKGAQLLLQAIADIKKVSDAIAAKCHDLKARLLVGSLQMDLFGNKVQLMSPHRFCVAHSSMQMLLPNKDKIKELKFILFNDMFLIATFASRFKSGQLVAVYPLIGLRVSIQMSMRLSLLTSKPHKFTLLPSNIVIIFDMEDKMKRWLDLIENSVEKHEHSFKQCNVVDLEKRVRKQKTSKEGRSETIAITNPNRLKEIERWRRVTNSKYNNISNLRLTPSLSGVPRKSEAARQARPIRSRTMPGLKRKDKDMLAKIIAQRREEKLPAPPVMTQTKSADKVRVMRDEEVLELDEEIPLENFMNALNAGFVKITNDDEQEEQYKKAAAQARRMVRHSLGNYRRYVTMDLTYRDSESDSDSDWDASDSNSEDDSDDSDWE